MSDNWIEHDGKLYNLLKIATIIPINDNEIILSSVINHSCWEYEVEYLKFSSNKEREAKIKEIKSKLFKGTL